MSVSDGKVPRRSRDRWIIGGSLVTAMLLLAVFALARALEAAGTVLFLLKLVALAAVAFALVVWAASLLLGRTRAERLALGLLTMAITLVACVILAEFGVRFALRNITTTADNTSYFSNKWNESNIRLNSLGFREREIPKAGNRESHRIIVLGDSFAFGQGLAKEKRFSDLIELELRESGRDAEVFNLARPGAETVDQLALLREVVLGLEPDVLLLQWFINDIEGRDKRGRPSSKPIWSHWTRRELHRKSALYFLVNTQVTKILQSFDSNRGYTGYLKSRFADPVGAEWKEYQRVLLELFREAQAANVPIGMVLFPRLVPELATEYPFEFIHRRILRECERAEVPCLDLSGAFAPHADDIGSLWLNRFDGHPNAIANQIAARQILDHFDQLLTSPPDLH